MKYASETARQLAQSKNAPKNLDITPTYRDIVRMFHAQKATGHWEVGKEIFREVTLIEDPSNPAGFLVQPFVSDEGAGQEIFQYPIKEVPGRGIRFVLEAQAVRA